MMVMIIININSCKMHLYCAIYPHGFKDRLVEGSTSSPRINRKAVSIENFFFFLVGYVEERPWWPIQSPNIGRKKKASS